MDSVQFAQLEKLIKTTIELSVAPIHADMKVLNLEITNVHKTVSTNKSEIMGSILEQKTSIIKLEKSVNDQVIEVKLMKLSQFNLTKRVSHIHSEHNKLEDSIITDRVSTAKAITDSGKTGVKEWTSFMGMIFLFLGYLWQLVSSGKPN